MILIHYFMHTFNNTLYVTVDVNGLDMTSVAVQFGEV